MSRTYRKHDRTVSETKVQYINRQIAYLRGWTWEWKATPHNKALYKKAVKDYEVAAYIFLKSGLQPYYKRPVKPRYYDYCDRVAVEVEYDYDEEVKRLSDEYDKFFRDGTWNETGRNTAFKKHCAKDLRHKNKEVIAKIRKGDDDWDQKPFPDTYMGKPYVWDYW